MTPAMPPKYDLHCHSTFSDGELSPEQLLSLASEQSITHLALTDHDTVAGLEAAQKAAQEHNIKLINGVELSVTWRNQLIHIVGLNVDPNNAMLKQGIAENQQRRIKRAEDMIEDFSKHGIDITAELKSVLKDAVPTRPHFAQALINLGLAKNKQQAFKRFLVRGKPGYIALEWPNIEDIANWVSSAGGTAVLAHPLRYKFTRTKLLMLIDDLKNCGINAIEASTPINDAQQRKMLEDICIQKNLWASMGSDFHAPNQPWARLGSAPELSAHINPVWDQL